MNNHNLSNCAFVTKELWFNTLYFSNEIIMNQLQIKSMIEYQQIIQKIIKLKEKQTLQPIPSREVLIGFKEIQQNIFENQFSQLRDYYFIRRQLLYIKNNPESSLYRPNRIQNQIFKKKIDLLSSIYEMERSLCLLELTRNITNNRNKLNVQLRNNENPKFNPKLRKLLRNWVESINQPDITLNKINYLAEHLNSKTEKNEFSRIWKNLKKNNFDLSLRFKKKYLKTEKCKFSIQERTPNENSEFLHNLESKPIIPWEIILNMIGINSLPFLSGQRTEHKRAIIELLNLYLMPITEQFDDIFRLKREYYLMCISFILLDFNIENVNYLPEAEGTSGFTSQTRINKMSGTLYKMENLGLNRYPSKSYMSSIFLVVSFIQNYLHFLKPSYVPRINNIFFHFTNQQYKKGITKMNLVNKKEDFQYSLNLLQLLIEPIEKGKTEYFSNINNFIKFMIEIFKKLCKILIFYQNECYFVHRDLHAGNIMVNFNINDNVFDILNFEVKIIDFTNSSIVIPNMEGQQCEFMNTIQRYFLDIKLSNPYINKNWDTFDLKYLIISLLFGKIYDDNKNKLEQNIFININKNTPLKNLRNVLLNIFGIQIDYLSKYKSYVSTYFQNNKIKCIPQKFEILIYRELLFNPEIFKNILGENSIDEKYKPLIFLHNLNHLSE